MNPSSMSIPSARREKQRLAISALLLILTGVITFHLPDMFPVLRVATDGSESMVPKIAYGQTGSTERQVLWVDVKDFISSATAEHVSSAIDRGSAGDFSAIIIALDTPGGSLDATLKIIESIQSSKVPVIGYVYPQGRSAWSAGTVILLGTDYAAMAPFTTIGSAQPVAGGIPVNDTKVINAMTEKMVTLAQLHNRNATQATRFITDNDNLTPEEAIQNHIIEAIAKDPADLLQIANNSTVTTLAGPKVLATGGSTIVVHEPSLRVSLVNVLADPLLSTTLFTIGFFALIYGLTSPGFGGEIAGAAMIILALIGQGFDINWAAFALLAIGAGLLAYELYSPGFGVMGIGGIVVLIIGATLMITQPVKPLLVSEEHLSELSLLSVTIIAPLGAFFALITYKAWRVKTRKPMQFVFQSEKGVTLDTVSSTKPGFILVGGEYWRAKTASGIEIGKGEKVRIVGKDADLLIVEPLQKEEIG